MSVKIIFFISLLIFGLLFSGCSTRNVNPYIQKVDTKATKSIPTKEKLNQEWIAIEKSPQEAKRWIDLGVPSNVAKYYEIDSYIYNCYQYNLSLDEMKKWIQLQVYNPSIINFLKYKGHGLESFKNKNLQQLLNTMKLDDFFTMMDMQDLRVVNGYIYHWKYDTNYKRFFHILKKYYGIQNN